MKVFRKLSDIKDKLANAVVTIGNFDGVHLGHREIFRQVKAGARDIGGVSVVITFDPHPLKVLAPEKALPLINTLEEKELLIEASGIDYLLIIPFDRQFAAISAEDFVKEILVARLGTRRLVIGYDYSFGRGREGNVDLLRRLGEKYNFVVEVIEPVGNGDSVFSSSRVRAMILDGEVRGIVSLLGRHFSIGGRVVHGHHRGKQFGFPTANIRTEKELIPKPGVFAVKVKLDDVVYDGACNIGYNPTFNDEGISIEVFLFNFDGDLYGRELRVFFIDRLRDEKKFADASELVKAIENDIKRCRDILKEVTIIEYRDYLENI